MVRARDAGVAVSGQAGKEGDHSTRSVVGISLPRGMASPLVGSQELEAAATARVVWGSYHLVWVTSSVQVAEGFDGGDHPWPWLGSHEEGGGDVTASSRAPSMGV